MNAVVNCMDPEQSDSCLNKAVSIVGVVVVGSSLATMIALAIASFFLYFR